MGEVTFSGRWTGRKRPVARRGRHAKAAGPVQIHLRLDILGAMVVVTVCMALLLSTAFAKSSIVKPASPPAQETVSDEVPEILSDQPDPAWIEHIRVLKVEQEEQQRVLADQRAREEAARAAELARLTSLQTAGSGAVTGELTPEEQARARMIDLYLTERGSPLAGYGVTFVKAGKMYLVDPALVVAIAGKESSWGKYCFKPFNAWGWGDESWLSWEQAINCITYNLGQEYVSTGLNTIHEMAPVYCPPSNGSWERDVTAFYYELLTLFRQAR